MARATTRSIYRRFDPSVPTAWRNLATTRREQHGVFNRMQAMGAGYRRSTIDSKVRTGEWSSLHPGVYCDEGVPQSWLRDMSSAVIWAQPACASGRAAAFLHRLPGFEEPEFELLTTNRRITSRCGINVHHTTRLPREQIERVQSIRCTSVERTILDLCGIVGRRRAAIALDHSLSRGMSTLGSFDFCLFLVARRGRNGCGILRQLLKERCELSRAPESPLETIIFEQLASSGLPLPTPQFELFDEAGHFLARPDFVWPEEKLIVEGHSRLWHSGKELEARDRERQLKLRHADYRIVYVSWPDAIAGTFVEVVRRHLRPNLL